MGSRSRSNFYRYATQTAQGAAGYVAFSFMRWNNMRQGFRRRWDSMNAALARSWIFDCIRIVNVSGARARPSRREV